MLTVTHSYVWYNGKTMPQATCDAYNAMSTRIEQREALGIDAEALRNGRHNLVVSWTNAVTPHWDAPVQYRNQ